MFKKGKTSVPFTCKNGSWKLFPFWLHHWWRQTNQPCNRICSSRWKGMYESFAEESFLIPTMLQIFIHSFTHRFRKYLCLALIMWTRQCFRRWGGNNEQSRWRSFSQSYVLVGKTDQQQGKNQRCVECAMCQVMIKHPNKAEINGVQIKYAMAREGWYLG